MNIHTTEFRGGLLQNNNRKFTRPESGGGRTRLPKFKFSAKFPIGLHVI